MRKDSTQTTNVGAKYCIALLVFILFLVMPAVVPRVVLGTTPSQVLVVYRTNSVDLNNNGIGDSQELANYYAQKREIPSDHLLPVTISVSTPYYDRNEYTKFYNDLVAPIKAKLAELGPTNIDVILLAGDIPIQVPNSQNVFVAVDNVLMALQDLSPEKNTIDRFDPFLEAGCRFRAARPDICPDRWSFCTSCG